MNQDANLLEFGQEFADAHTLLISEVKVLLNVQMEKRLLTSSSINPVMKDTFDYCSRFSKFSNKQTAKQVRQLFQDNLHDFEMAQLANLCCQTSEEAKSLIPSLEKVNDEELQSKLNELQQLIRYQ